MAPTRLIDLRSERQKEEDTYRQTDRERRSQTWTWKTWTESLQTEDYATIS